MAYSRIEELSFGKADAKMAAFMYPNRSSKVYILGRDDPFLQIKRRNLEVDGIDVRIA